MKSWLSRVKASYLATKLYYDLGENIAAQMRDAGPGDHLMVIEGTVLDKKQMYRIHLRYYRPDSPKWKVEKVDV